MKRLALIAWLGVGAACGSVNNAGSDAAVLDGSGGDDGTPGDGAPDGQPDGAPDAPPDAVPPDAPGTPQLVIAPGSHDFGSVPTGTTAVEPFTVTNQGTGPSGSLQVSATGTGTVFV